MPDTRRDLAGREQLMGSMRATLLALHEQTHEAAPLCRLQGLLQGHADALAAAYPDDLDKLETRSARARHDEATKQLATFGPDACKPPPPPEPAPALLPVEQPEPPPKTLVSPPTAPTENPGPRRLQIAGGVMLPVGLVALGVLGALASRHRQDLARGDALQTELTLRPCTDDDRTLMRGLLATTRREEGLIIALGLTGAALVTAGTALLIRGGLQRRRARLGLALQRHGAGLTLSGAF